MLRPLSFITSLLLLSATAPTTMLSRAQDPVAVTVKPGRVLIERTESEQLLNFDFLLENKSDRPLRLFSVEVQVFDKGGQLARRDFVDLYSRRSLELTPMVVVPAKGKALLYNPLAEFSRNMPLHRLTFDFMFTSEDGKDHHFVRAEVRPEEYKTKTALILPVKGRVLIWDAHERHAHHRRTSTVGTPFSTNFQRFGYDFVVVDEAGQMYKGAPRRTDSWYRGSIGENSEWLGFGVDIIAAADGVVAGLWNSDKDNRRFNQSDLLYRETAYAGNYVVLDHGNGEFTWYGHLKEGSVKVKKGDRVKQGQVLGSMGASGSSLFPHLHFELRTGAGARGVEGLPATFRGFTRVLGAKKVKVRQGSVTGGDILESR